MAPSLSTVATQSLVSFEKRPSRVESLTTNTSPDKGPVECTDSGYGSSQSTPDIPSSEVGNFDPEYRVSRQLFSSSKKTKLRPFDQEISQAVENRFSDLTELFGPSLYSFLVKRGVKYTAISVKLKVLGKDEGSAKPWVVVQCDKSASKPIKNFFDQPDVKSQYRPGDSEPDLPSFDVVIHPRAPVPLAASDQAIVYGKCSTDVDTLCGNIIKVGSLDKHHTATLGGIIKIKISPGNFMMLGLTAGHILMREPIAAHDNGRESPSTSIHTAHSSCEPAPTHLNPEVQEVEDGFAHDDGHTQEQEDGESAAGYELDEEDFEIDLAVEIDKAAEGPTSFQDSSLDSTTQDSQEQSWSKIGSVYSTSRDIHAGPEPDQQSGLDQDWALVNISPHFCRPNLVAAHPSGAIFVELTEISGELEKSKGSRAVVLVSGTAGLERGSLSSSPSFLMLGQAKSFTKTYNLVLNDGTAPNTGDSGSWVVDKQSYGVYGHLVASDAFREAYVVPFENILLDIKHSLGALSICLPTRSEISAWHRVSHLDLRSNELPARKIHSPPGADTAWHRGSHVNLNAWHRGSHVDLRSSRLSAPIIHSPASVDSGYSSCETASVRSGASVQSSFFRENLKFHKLPEKEELLEDELLEEEELEHIGKRRTSGSIEPEQPVANRRNSYS